MTYLASCRRVLRPLHASSFRRMLLLVQMPALLGIWNVQVVSGQVPQAQGGPANEGEAQESIPRDSGDFEQVRGPRTRNGPGILAYGGYCSLEAQLTKSGYQDATDRAREATVEIVVHPRDYEFVPHDFFGTFLVSLREQNMKAAKANVQDQRGLLSWIEEKSPGGRPIVMCAVIFPTDKNALLYEGVVGWYHAEASKITSVMIRFDNLKGIPSTIINRELANYPSSVTRDESQFRDWDMNNIAKWSKLLRQRGNEELILDAGLRHLRAYDDQSFGLVESWTKRTDPLALSKAIDGAIERMNGWVEERKKKAREADQMGE